MKFYKLTVCDDYPDWLSFHFDGPEASIDQSGQRHYPSPPIFTLNPTLRNRESQMFTYDIISTGEGDLFSQRLCELIESLSPDSFGFVPVTIRGETSENHGHFALAIPNKFTDALDRNRTVMRPLLPSLPNGPSLAFWPIAFHLDKLQSAHIHKIKDATCTVVSSALKESIERIGMKGLCFEEIDAR